MPFIPVLTVRPDSLFVRLENLAAHLRRAFPGCRHDRGQGRRPEFLAGVIELAMALARRLHRNARFKVFPLCRNALGRMLDVPEHLIRRFLPVLETLGVVEKVSRLQRRRENLGLTPGAKAYWYAPSQFVFSPLACEILSPKVCTEDANAPSAEPATDLNVTLNLKELETAGNTGASIKIGDGVLASCLDAPSEDDENCEDEDDEPRLSDAQREALREAEVVAEDDRLRREAKARRGFYDRRAPQAIEAQAIRKRQTAREIAETYFPCDLEEAIADFDLLLTGRGHLLLPDIRTTKMATRLSRRPVPAIRNSQKLMAQESEAIRNARNAVEGKIDPLDVWGIHPGKTVEQSRQLHIEEAHLFLADMKRRWTERNKGRGDD